MFVIKENEPEQEAAAIEVLTAAATMSDQKAAEQPAV